MLGECYVEDLPNIAILHTHNDVANVIHEGPKERNYIRRIAFVHNLQLPNYSLANFLLCFDVNDLRG